jgi:hypothetical protein
MDKLKKVHHRIFKLRRRIISFKAQMKSFQNIFHILLKLLLPQGTVAAVTEFGSRDGVDIL